MQYMDYTQCWVNRYYSMLLYFQMVKATMQESKEAIDCWIYLLHHFRPELLELPHLSTYFSKGDFVPRHMRDIKGPEYWSDVKLPEALWATVL